MSTTDLIRERTPERGAHIRAMHYLTGSVRYGTHANADLSFTGTVHGTVRDGAPWVAVVLDRDLTVEETVLLGEAGARTLTVRAATAVIVPAAALDTWTFETLTALRVIDVFGGGSGTIYCEEDTTYIDTVHRLLAGGRDNTLPTPGRRFSERQYATVKEFMSAYDPPTVSLQPHEILRVREGSGQPEKGEES